MNSNISPSTTIAYVNTGLGSRTLVLPISSNIQGKYITIKDSAGQAFQNTITVRTSSGDVFENGVNLQTITVGYGFATYFVRSNIWYSISDTNSATGGINTSISSISSIVAYGLSTVSAGHGVSSLSSIVAYGLSSIQRTLTTIIQSSNLGVTTNNVVSLHNKTVVSDASARIILFINDIPVSSNTVAANIQSVYNNGSLIVGVGVGIIVYSSDGSNWSNAARNPLPGVTITSVTYGNGLWVATGSGLNTRNIIYSTDGSYWVQNPYVFPNALNTVSYNSNYWIVGGENNSTANDGNRLNTIYRTSNITNGSFIRAASGGFGHRANVVEWGFSNWVAVGQYYTNANDVQYSSDGINWVGANITPSGGNVFFGGAGQDGNGVAYGNSNWLICGGGQGSVRTRLFRSQNGITFSNITTNVESAITDLQSVSYDMYDLKYSAACNAFYMTVSQANGLTQYFLKSTNNGDSWTNIRSNVGATIYRAALGYGTSPISNTVATTIGNGVINTTTIISCNMDTTNIYSENIYISNTLTVDTIYATTIPIVSYGLSTIYEEPTPGVSSLSTIVSYGLSTVSGGHGLSSLSSIVSYGLSSVAGGHGLSSLSSIIAYGLSTAGGGGEGISSLSSIVAYGLSTVSGGHGVSSLSSIVAYGLSTVSGGQGISSLSSIVAYGLSSVSGGEGISSLSSIVAYGLSSVAGGHGISSLSSIVAYGLSTVSGGHGLSSLSSIVAYGLSSILSNISSLTGTRLGQFNNYDQGGVGLSTLTNPPPDTITDALYKVDNWLFTNLVGQAPLPSSNFFYPNSNSNTATVTFTPPFQFKSGLINRWMPYISTLNLQITNSSGNVNLFFQTGNRDFLPKGLSNTLGLFIDGRNGNAYSNATWLASCNGLPSMFYIPASNLSNAGSPYTIRIWYQNFSTQPIRAFSNIWTFSNGIDVPSAPFSVFFTTYNDSYGCTCDC